MMGNTTFHRLPALFAASFATCGLGLLAISGSICQFVELRAKKDQTLFIPGANHVTTETYTYLGVICRNPLYDDTLDEEVTSLLSKVFLFVAIACGSFTCVLSWALSTFLSPTEANWKMLSIFAAVSALLQMPVFLVFETSPCTSYPSEQECVLATGSFYLILSTTFWVVVTIATQFLDPPRWADEMNAWRTKTPSGVGMVSANGDEGESQAPLLLPKKKTKFLGGIQRWTNERDASSVDLPKNQTDSLSIGDDEDTQPQQQIVPYNASKSKEVEEDAATGVDPSNELDAIMIIVEEGRLKEATPLEPPSRNASFAHDDPENLQVALWDSMREEETAKKQLVKKIYHDLENPEPVKENQLVVQQSTATSQWALPIQPEPRKHLKQVEPSTEPTAIVKSQSVIKSFADNLMMRSRIRCSKQNNYCLMDDDDSEASSHFLPSEVIIPSSENSISPGIPGTPTRQAEFPCYDETALVDHSRNSSYDYEDNEEYPDPILSYMGSFESSTDEEEPDPIFSPVPSSEMDESENAGDDDDCDSDSSSKSSGSGEWGPQISSRGRATSKRVRGRGYSSVRSVVSSTSLLDTMIQEETEADLEEFEDAAPYDLVRSKSAPVQLYPNSGNQRSQHDDDLIHFELDHASVSTLGSSLFHNPSADLTDRDLQHIQLAPIMSQRSRSLSSQRRDVRHYPSSVGGSIQNSSFDTELEDPVDCISFSSSVHQVQVTDNLGVDGTALGPDDENSKLDQSRPDDKDSKLDQPRPDDEDSKLDQLPPLPSSTSNSFEHPGEGLDKPAEEKTKTKCFSPLSPALTAPETPSPDSSSRAQQQTSLQDLSTSYESETSWKEERERRGGIHALPIDDLERSFDEEAAEVSFRVREARIRRLQREKEIIKCGRACSQGATYRRRPSPTAMSSVVDKLDLQLIEVLRPDGVEYGPDEGSL